MDVNFMNPFVDSAAEVLKAEAGLSVTRGAITMHKSALTTNDITVLLSMIGQVQGVVLYEMPFATALALVSRVMGQEFAVFDNLAQSGMAELGNVITGRATVRLSQAGYQATISPPTLIQGRGVTISTLDFSRLVVPLVTEHGELVVHLALRQSASDKQNVGLIPLVVESQKAIG